MLLAEDDLEFRRLLARMLDAHGYEVVETGTGVDFLEFFSDALLTNADLDALCDLIVTDIRMPGLSGLTILDGLRKAGCTTPAIVVTAFGDATTRAAAESLGATLLDKPFELDALCELADQLAVS